MKFVIKKNFTVHPILPPYPIFYFGRIKAPLFRFACLWHRLVIGTWIRGWMILRLSRINSMTHKTNTNPESTKFIIYYFSNVYALRQLVHPTIEIRLITFNQISVISSATFGPVWGPNCIHLDLGCPLLSGHGVKSKWAGNVGLSSSPYWEKVNKSWRIEKHAQIGRLGRSYSTIRKCLFGLQEITELC